MPYQYFENMTKPEKMCLKIEQRSKNIFLKLVVLKPEDIYFKRKATTENMIKLWMNSVFAEIRQQFDQK